MNTDAFFDDLNKMQPTPGALLAHRPAKDRELSMLNAYFEDLCGDLQIPKTEATSMDPADVAAALREMARSVEMRDELAEQEAADEEADYQERQAEIRLYSRASMYI